MATQGLQPDRTTEWGWGGGLRWVTLPFSFSVNLMPSFLLFDPPPPHCCLSPSVVQTLSVTDVSGQSSIETSVSDRFIHNQLHTLDTHTLRHYECFDLIVETKPYLWQVNVQTKLMCITVGQEWFPRLIKKQFGLSENLTLPPCYLKPPAEMTWTILVLLKRTYSIKWKIVDTTLR